MNRYYDGSSAYKIDTYETAETVKRGPVAVDDSKIYEIRKKRKKAVAALCFYLSVVFALAVGTIYTKVLVLQAQTNVSALETELAELTKENNDKKISIEQSIDLKKIEEIAISQYGMQRLDKNQTVYVKVVQDDYGEVVSDKGSDSKIKSYFVRK